MKVTLTDDTGREYDITEHFEVMYDQLTMGLDWGSGFLDANEALIVMQAGAAAGFKINIEARYDTSNMVIPNLNYRWNTKARQKWIDENLGDPMTWDSIAAYREKLREMEDSE